MEKQPICKTEKNERKRNVVIIVVAFILLTILAYAIMNIKFYDKPKVDITAEAGSPNVAEIYEYSTLEINDGYEIGLCGNPKVEDDNIELYITNTEENNVWIKVQILDEEENVIGETGIIEPNHFVKDIKLKEKMEGDISIKIVEYEIDTYNSKGTVKLKI